MVSSRAESAVIDASTHSHIRRSPSTRPVRGDDMVFDNFTIAGTGVVADDAVAIIWRVTSPNKMPPYLTSRC